MKKIALTVLLFGVMSLANVDVYVHGYTKSNGTYVAPYHRSDPDETKSNNYSTYGNTNSHNEKKDTRDLGKKIFIARIF